MDCSFQPEISLDEWIETLLSPIKGGRYPLSGSIELTDRCNLSCQHCYINQPANDCSTKSRELTTTQWIEVIDQIADAGCLFLLITGGEPLLRPDFEEIFYHVRERGILVSLFSNGTMLTPQKADFLAENNLQSLEISLYGATPETYESVTRVKGSFSHCMHGIELALERDIPISLKSVLLVTNKHELEDIQVLAKSYGVKNFRYDGTLWPRLDGNLAPLRYQISVDDQLTMDLQDMERFEKWTDVVDQFAGQLLRSERVFTCGAALRSFHIDAYGQLSPCAMVRKPSFDLLERGFTSAWGAMGEIHTWKRHLNTECETCTANALCSQCPGWSLAVHGDYETPVSTICELGKKRAQQIASLQLPVLF